MFKVVPADTSTSSTSSTNDVSVLDVEVDGVNFPDEMKARFVAQGLNLTDAQWATATFTISSGTANQIKTLKYDSTAQ